MIIILREKEKWGGNCVERSPPYSARKLFVQPQPKLDVQGISYEAPQCAHRHSSISCGTWQTHIDNSRAHHQKSSVCTDEKVNWWPRRPRVEKNIFKIKTFWCTILTIREPTNKNKTDNFWMKIMINSPRKFEVLNYDSSNVTSGFRGVFTCTPGKKFVKFQFHPQMKTFLEKLLSELTNRGVN